MPIVARRIPKHLRLRNGPWKRLRYLAHKQYIDVNHIEYIDV